MHNHERMGRQLIMLDALTAALKERAADGKVEAFTMAERLTLVLAARLEELTEALRER